MLRGEERSGNEGKGEIEEHSRHREFDEGERSEEKTEEQKEIIDATC